MISPLPLVQVIDDVPENITVLGSALAHSCRIRAATSGQEGLDLIFREPPDLILVDIMMPGMNGYEVFAQLKSDPKTEEIPVIFVTARADAESETNALFAGAADFIHKPINPEVARARVKIQLELVRYRRDLERKVLERTEELATARAEAESAQAVVTSFMKNVSHEMRTPMHGILGVTQMLLDKFSGSELPKLASYLGMLSRSAQRMNKLVESLLQLANQQYSEMTQITPGALTSINMHTLLEHCLLTHEKLAAQRQQTLSLECRASNPRLVGDPDRLRQVFDALIGNALRYSPESTPVVVRIEDHPSSPNYLTIKVIDRGCGIPPKEMAAIFEPFYESSRTASGAGGTGLGLPLCKAIIERHHGKISVANGEGGGAVFEVELATQLSLAEVKID